MVYVTPWSKEAEKILNRIMKTGRADVFDIDISRSFGRHCAEIVDDGYLEIARVEKKKKTIILPGINVVMFPKKGKFFFHKR